MGKKGVEEMMREKRFEVRGTGTRRRNDMESHL